MKKTVLTFGVISGLISAVTMLATVPFMHKISGDKGLILGYTTIVLAGLLVYFGIRSYRDNVSAGKLTFARGLAVGILISLLSNCFYVATWEVVSYKFMPDFAEKYASQMVEHAKSTGASQQKIDETARQAKDLRAQLPQPALQHLDDVPGTLPGLPGHLVPLRRHPEKKDSPSHSVSNAARNT